jgi:hypothetical protein
MSLLPELCAFVGETNERCRHRFRNPRAGNPTAHQPLKALSGGDGMRKILFAMVLLSCAACGVKHPDENATAVGNELPAASVQVNSIQPDATAGLPEDHNVVAEGPIDPKSAQGAGQVLQHFAALLEQKRFGEARALGEEDFTTAFVKDAEVHAEIGAPGQIEGAAGSSYVEIPIRFYGKHQHGSAFSQAATATLRRVNDVPGSSAAQRRWRIYRLEMQPAT